VMLLLPMSVQARDYYSYTLEDLLHVPVTVTAQRRIEKIQDTPVAVTAYTGTSLSEVQLFETSDLAFKVPNLSISPSASILSNIRIFMRGLGQSESIMPTAESAVGLYFDDVYLGRLNGANFKLFDIERIEILRGPQGTLYGRNTVTGAIKFYSRPPDQESRLNFSAGYGSQNKIEFQASGNSGFADEAWAANFALAYSDTDGFTDRYSAPSVKIESKLGDLKYKGGRLSLRYLYSDTFDALGSLNVISDDGDANYMTPLSPGPNPQPLTGSDLYSTMTSQEQSAKTDQVFGSLNLTWRLDGFDIKSISGFRTVDNTRFVDISGQDIWYIDTDVDGVQWSQELQVSGLSLEDSLNWIVGIYYLYEDSDADSFNSLSGGMLTSRQAYTVTTDSYAAFGQVSYDFIERLTLTVGWRYSSDLKDFDGSTANTGGLWVDGSATQSERFSSWTPKVGAEYRWQDNILIYGSYSEGFKAGGFQGHAFNASDLSTHYSPETTKTTEAGLKSDFLDDRLRVNFNYYYNDFEDMHMNGLNQAVGGGTVIQNAAEARVHGIELEIAVAPYKSLSIFANLGTATGEYKKLSPDILNVTIDSDIANMPKFTSNLGFHHHIQVSNLGEIMFGADYQHTDSFHPGAKNSDTTKVPTVDLFNAFIKYISADQNWDIALYGKNLTDEEYHYTGFSFSSFDSVLPAAPLTLKVVAGFRFG
ncbi:MAG: TonB-dependent receptor, partial [bacterium]|nr:TonB-dependent receptor [bacterium]